MSTEITAEEYKKIFAENTGNMVVHATFTDMTGSGYEWSNGNPQHMTEWGLRDADSPLVRLESETIDGKEEITYSRLTK